MPVNQQGTLADLTKVGLPVKQVEFQPLSTTTTAASAWIDISGLPGLWTLFVKGLETGATVKIEVSNESAAPAGNGAVLTSTLGPDANNCAQFTNTAPWHWLRITKTQGGTPTASLFRILANVI